MVWKVINISNPGTSTKFGADDTDKINKGFSGIDVDDYDINSDFKFRSGKLQLANPANTFKYTIVTAAITGDVTLNVPTASGTDSLVLAGAANTWTGSQKMETHTDLKAIAEPASPSSGYVRLFIDTADGKIKIKRSSGDVVVIE